MILHPCQNCQQPHALFYYIDDDGTRKLSYYCDKVLVLGSAACEPVTKMATRRYDVPMEEGLQIPEVWSPAWTRLKKAEKQYQMVMMKQPEKI